MAIAPPSALDLHCDQVARAIADGRVVPLLGAGANLCGRTADFEPGGDVLPSGGELAQYLATYSGYPDDSMDLVRVAQYVSAVLGDAPLYEKLHSLFAADYGPNDLHHFLAGLPAFVGSLPEKPRDAYQLIVTTNYDDALEMAFRKAGVEFDLVTYMCPPDDLGHFVHRPPDGDPVVINEPNAYEAVDLSKRTVIVKVHGAVDRDCEDAENDSYVITEDDYINYLTQTDVSRLLPSPLVMKLRRSHMLFLGYSLRDWNLRAIFHRIWKERARSYTAWAIQKDADGIDMRFWRDRGVEILDVGLEQYIGKLTASLGRIASPEPRP